MATGSLEGLNGILLIERSMSIIQLLDAIWTWCHEQRVARAEQARKWIAPDTRDFRKWTPWAEELLIARDWVAKQCEIIGQVQSFVNKVST